MLEEVIDNPILEKKVYKDRAFWLGTFLGGPLVAGYFLAENFKSIGESEKVKNTWIITIVLTIVIFGSVFLIPEDVNIPGQLIPIAYSAIAFGLFKKYQEPQINLYIQKGGEYFGWGRVVLVSLLSLLLIVGIGVLLFVGVDLFYA